MEKVNSVAWISRKREGRIVKSEEEAAKRGNFYSPTHLFTHDVYLI
jgi:hypothetical protein